MVHRAPDPSALGRSGAPPGVPPIGRELALTAKSVRAWVDEALSRHGASLTTWILLQSAAAPDHPPSQRELARSMSIGGATLVRHIDRLEADGLLRRDPDPNDRRVTRISLTPAGQRRFAEIAGIARQIDAELRALITDREEQVLRSVLERLRAHTASTPSTIDPSTIDPSTIDPSTIESTNETDVA